jgi:hypothetical protein
MFLTVLAPPMHDAPSDLVEGIGSEGIPLPVRHEHTTIDVR